MTDSTSGEVAATCGVGISPGRRGRLGHYEVDVEAALDLSGLHGWLPNTTPSIRWVTWSRSQGGATGHPGAGRRGGQDPGPLLGVTGSR
jgi:hypothetical protein